MRHAGTFEMVAGIILQKGNQPEDEMGLYKTEAANLELTWKRSTQVSMAGILGGLILLFLYFPDIRPVVTFKVPVSEPDRIEMIPLTVQAVHPPEPIRPAVPVAVPNETMIPNEMIYHSSEVSEVPITPPSLWKPEETEPGPIDFWEEAPVLIGGTSALMKEIRYPDQARQLGIGGTVLARIVVNKSGGVESVEIIKSLGYGLDEEVIRALKLMKFQPALQQGKPVKVRMAIPVRFSVKSGF